MICNNSPKNNHNTNAIKKLFLPPFLCIVSIESVGVDFPDRFIVVATVAEFSVVPLLVTTAELVKIAAELVISAPLPLPSTDFVE